jgi:benzoylformate decarboxylase
MTDAGNATDARTGADLFLDALEQYGVSHLFGNPGTTELPLMRALPEREIEYVLGLHEDVAVGMAGGYASTRRYHADGASNDATDDVLPVGVANLHVTPGLAHGLGNLYAAAYAGAPLVVTAGNHDRGFRHEEPILSGDLVGMADQFTKWSEEVLDVDALPTMLRRAFRVAFTPPTGPVFLALPMDVLRAETDADPEPLGPIPTAGRGDPDQIAHAADLLADADNPVLVVGDHVARAGRAAVDSAVAFAEAAGARVHDEILACEVNFPQGHDQYVSAIPPDEGMASSLMSGDTVVFVGCSTNTTLWAHEGELVGPTATTIHVGQDAWELGKNHPADAAVLGDPGEVLAGLADAVEDRLTDDEREQRLSYVETLKSSLADTVRAMGEDPTPEGDDRASKATLVDELHEHVPDAYIVDESITSKYALLTRWEFEPQGYISNKGGGLGYGLPAAVGAAIAEDQRADPRTVVGFVGDGSYLYYPHAIHSAVRQGVDLTVVIPDNRNYRILKENTASIFGGDADEYAYEGMDFDPPVDLPANAESHGARGHRAETREDVGPTLKRALESGGVDVVDVFVHD